MRRLALVLVGCALILAGCGGGETVSPLPERVAGTLPKAQALPKGNAAAGKAVFAGQGCNGCHTYAPAGSKATTGPDLDKLAQYAKQANQGSLDEFTRTSIVNPSAYVQPGYQDIMPKTYSGLAPKQLADLVAFLTQKQT